MANQTKTKKIDDLGRVVIPIELREELGIEKHDALNIYIEDGKIVISKAENKCIFCQSEQQLTQIKNKHICVACITDMNSR